jgi:hypothetical protein
MQVIYDREEEILDDVEIPDELVNEWDIARKNFGSEIFFFAPSIKRYETSEYKNGFSFFIPVSVTGKSCQLGCEHCEGKILEMMHHVSSPSDLLQYGKFLYERGAKGLLISGGSLRDGTVPLGNFMTAIRELKERYDFKIVVHVGFVNERVASELRRAKIDSAMIDVVGAEETLSKVCHLNASPLDYKRSLEILTREGIPTTPHIVIGLHYGHILGEYNALRIISDFKISSLVLVIFTPLFDTPMQWMRPPSPDEIKEIFKRARRMLPSTPIYLGCMRPVMQKTEIDTLAIKSGFNGIAYPQDGIVNFSKRLGLTPRFSEYCCSIGT